MSLDLPNKELHRQLREYYEKNGMDKPVKPAHHHNGCPCDKCNPPYILMEEKRIVPAGVNFATGQRVSGKLRTRYLDHLRDLYEQEYFGHDELSARLDAMLLANTKEELDFLLYDLPKLPVEVAIIKPEEKKGDPYSASTAFSVSAIAAFVIALTGAFSHFASGNTGEQAIFGLSLAWMITFTVLALVMKKR